VSLLQAQQEGRYRVGRGLWVLLRLGASVVGSNVRQQRPPPVGHHVKGVTYSRNFTMASPKFLGNKGSRLQMVRHRPPISSRSSRLSPLTS
jgi:hypothetical protein